MKNLCDPAIAKYRDHAADQMYRTPDNERALGGAFLVPFKRPGKLKTELMRVLASSGKDMPEPYGFDHVSVSLSDRCPTWEEMDFVKRLFFKDDEIAYQLHMPPSANISNHAYCLHIWRPVKAQIPLPPADTVGFHMKPPATETAVKP